MMHSTFQRISILFHSQEMPVRHDLSNRKPFLPFIRSLCVTHVLAIRILDYDGLLWFPCRKSISNLQVFRKVCSSFVLYSSCSFRQLVCIFVSLNFILEKNPSTTILNCEKMWIGKLISANFKLLKNCQRK